ncbi:MAG: hypothetical protein ACLTTO_11790 [Lachnospiraceae bacterium]
METEIKMLSDIHKNADMGQDTLRHILDATKDAEFSKTVSRQMQEYEKAFQVSGQMLKARNAPEEQKEAPMISKMDGSHEYQQEKYAGYADFKTCGNADPGQHHGRYQPDKTDP